MTGLFYKPVCSACGSDDVKVDAWAIFNATTQDFELVSTSLPARCAACDAETSLNTIPLEGRELIQARAHALALENGWLPSDEDSAISYCEDYSLDYTQPTEDEEEANDTTPTTDSHAG